MGPREWGMEKELHSLYRSPNIVRVIKSKSLRWTGHVVRVIKCKVVRALTVDRFLIWPIPTFS